MAPHLTYPHLGKTTSRVWRGMNGLMSAYAWNISQVHRMVGQGTRGTRSARMNKAVQGLWGDGGRQKGGGGTHVTMPRSPNMYPPSLVYLVGLEALGYEAAGDPE